VRLPVPGDGVVPTGGRDDQIPPPTGGDATRGGLPVALYHGHLPKLAVEGVVEFDEASGTVSRGPAFDEVAPVLAVLVEHANRFPSGLD